MAQYTDEFIERLHLVWGEGFLSPGGPEEVGEIVRGLGLAGKRVLDIGCGSGGPAMALAREHGAKVTGVDIEDGPLARARAFVEKNGLSGQITLMKVEPGPLPFEDASFDAVFTKDSLIHVPDKAALYAEILRVLVPGGVFVGSDWLAGPTAEGDRAMEEFLRLGHLEFRMATAAETFEILRDAGFDYVRMRDRNQWFRARTSEENAALAGELRPDLERIMGAEGAEHTLTVRRALEAAAWSGALRPTHIRAKKPE